MEKNCVGAQLTFSNNTRAWGMEKEWKSVYGDVW